eukprot:1027487-Prorocentrum_minimum.AAC.1
MLSDSEMSDNSKSDNSQTESDSSVDAKNQRKPLERNKDVEKDANSSKKDSKRSTRARAGANRSNGPAVTRGGERREDAHSGGASAPTTGHLATKADATEWQKVEHKRKKEGKDKEPMPNFKKKASRVSQEEIPS